MNFDSDNQKKIMDTLMEIFQYDLAVCFQWLSRPNPIVGFSYLYCIIDGKSHEVLKLVLSMKEKYAQEKAQKQS